MSLAVVKRTVCPRLSACWATFFKIPPTFAFIDPFGWTGVPFDLVKEILSAQSCEVMINFMFEEIDRFFEHPDQEHNFDSLFGTPDWRKMKQIADPRARREFLHGLYLEQLRSAAGGKYVRSFEMRNGKDGTDYFRFFATNNAKGMAKMKEAMWKVDQTGEFRFSDATNPSQALLAVLERAGIVAAIDAPAGRKAATYADPQLKIRFAQ